MNCKGGPYWLRRLARQLLEIDHVRYVYARPDCVRVEYTTGFKRVYTYKPRGRYLWASPITQDQSSCSWPIGVGYEHEWNPLDRNEQKRLSKYFHIPRSKIDTLSYIERELLVQHLIGTILKLGYIRPYWSEQVISAELERLKTAKLRYRGVFDMYANTQQHPRPGRSLIETYCDVANVNSRGPNKTLANAFTNPKILFVVLQCIIHKHKWDLNITTLHTMLYRMHYGRIWYHPTVLKAAIQEAFDITPNTTLVDASPNLYEKGLSAWMLGCKYATIGPDPPTAFADRIGLRVVKAEKPYDLLVVDNGFRPIPIDRMRELRDSSDNMLAFVHRDQADEIADQLRPSKRVKLKVVPTCFDRKPDFLFIYRTAKIL